MSQNPLDHPLLQAQVERALAPYRKLLPPEILEEFRGMLTVALATHPVTSRILRRLGVPPIVDASTTVERAGAADAAARVKGGSRAGGDGA